LPQRGSIKAAPPVSSLSGASITDRRGIQRESGAEAASIGWKPAKGFKYLEFPLLKRLSRDSKLRPSSNLKH
jgi:hypothetical protein